MLPIFSVFLFFCVFHRHLPAQIKGPETGNRNTVTAQNFRDSARASFLNDEIVFLMLRVAKDSASGNTSVSLLDKVVKRGSIKSSRSGSGMMRLPFLSFVFYRGHLPVDSFRQNYPLRERIQNTRTNMQGYQDIEVHAREIFLRFQKPDADQLKIYVVTASDTQEALHVTL